MLVLDQPTGRTPLENAHEAYRAGFDGLRAVAVSMVWLSHLYAPYFRNGGMGVDVFFVLSGYLITGVIAKEQAANGWVNLVNFYARRTLRLVPALWLLLGACLLWYAFDVSARAGLLGAIFSAGSYTMNFNRIFGWMGSGPLGHTWSLAIEEQFYLLWPLLLAVLPRRAWLSVAIALAVASSIWRTYLAADGASAEWLYTGIDCRADLLLLGCACSLLGQRLKKDLIPTLRYAWPVAAFVLLLLYAIPPSPSAVYFSLLVILTGACSAILILAIDLGVLRRGLTSRLLIALGRISYGVYLWHYPILYIMESYRFEGAWRLLNIPLTLAVAIASFQFVERRALRLKTHFVSAQGRHMAD